MRKVPVLAGSWCWRRRNLRNMVAGWWVWMGVSVGPVLCWVGLAAKKSTPLAGSPAAAGA